MGATPNLKLPFPEAIDLADGPKAFEDLATETEKKMTTRRLWTAYRENAGVDGSSGALANPGGTATVLSSRNVPLVALGWAEIELTATIIQETGGDPQNWAGYVFGYFNGVLCGSYRFHSHQRTKHLTASLHAEIDLSSSVTAFAFTATMSCDSLSQNAIRVVEVDANITQFGALR